MGKPFYSSSWYRVAALKPRLRSHVQLHRHQYRGELWYVLQDHASQHYYRFSPAAYAFIGAFDGQRTIEEIWKQAGAAPGTETPTQDEVIQLLAQLFSADALQCDVPPDISAMFLSRDRERHRQWQSRLLNPLFWQFRLFDPERLLQRLLPLARHFFGRAGAVLWLLVVITAVMMGAVHWQDLTHDITDRVLAPQNLLMLWLLFPIVKMLHEFGHAFAVKLYGGEVHEMGVALLMLQPVPYVDASAASAFSAKSQRILVSAAGMLVELLIASLALFVWLNVEPGIIRAIAYNIVFIAGVSTVLFNANPLLRYDGYYILADYLEIPNLRARGHAYLGFLCERTLFGCEEATFDPTTATERCWLIVYSIASFVYRILVLLAIASFIASKFFFLGVMIALSGLAAGVVVPGAKILLLMWTSPRLRGVRRRAVTATALVLASLACIVTWLPLPLRTRAEGVIWIPEQAHVRARTDGFVDRVVAQAGAKVRRGDILIICQDPQLAAQVKVLEFRLEELKTRYAAQWLEDVRQAQIVKDEILHVEERLARARERLSELVIKSRADGTFVIPQVENLPGRFVQQGARLAYVLDFTALTARVVVPQSEVDLVRYRSKKIEIRLADRLDPPITAVIAREVPAATEQLPSTALGTQGGGSIVVDPVDQRGAKALQKLFQFDLGLPSTSGIMTMGGRVYVLFDHGAEPLLNRWLRELRQLFLSKFNST